MFIQLTLFLFRLAPNDVLPKHNANNGQGIGSAFHVETS